MVTRSAALIACSLCACLRFSSSPKANNAPVAVISQNALVAAPNDVIALDGSGSYDDDGDAVTYAWDIASSTDAIAVDDSSAAVTTLTLPARGQRVFVRLVVNDGAEDSIAALLAVRVNTPPIADAGPTRTGAPPLFVDADALDGENDLVSRWEWRVTRAPSGAEGCLDAADACIADPQVASARFEPPVPGEYTLAVRAGDDVAFGAWDETTVVVLQGNRAPVLALNRTSEVAIEGTPFSQVNASASSDPDGDTITVTWTKVEGGVAFAQTLIGAQPAPVAPAFLPKSDNSARYSVVASDGKLTSDPQVVTLHSAPGAGFVVVSHAFNAADAPLCGTVSFPCRSLIYALSRVDQDGNGSGDGRHIVMTSDSFAEVPASTAAGIVWKSGTSLYGGRDPVTFGRGQKSEITIDSTAGGCSRPGLVLGSTVVNVDIDNVAITESVNNCQGDYGPLVCNGCTFTLSQSSVSATANQAVGNTVRVIGGAHATIVDSDILAASSFNVNRCLYADGASTVTIERSRLHTAGASPSASGADNSALRSDGAFITARASLFRLSGSYSNTVGGQPSAGIYLKGGTFFGENIDVVETVHEVFSGIYAETATPLTLINATLVGPASSSGIGPGVLTPGAVAIMNSLFSGFRVGVNLSAPAAYGSKLYANVFDGIGTAVACGGMAIVAASDLNGATAMATCNQSSQAWSNNAAGNCTFVNAAMNDYRLAAGANACVDAGVSTSPVGTAPAVDKEETTRPMGNALDVGSDER